MKVDQKEITATQALNAKGETMAKFKVTSKEVKQNYSIVISIGYCGAQALLRYEKPIAYNSGVYGWNYDLYEISDNIAITTGYRPIGKSIDYTLLGEAEYEAINMLNNSNESIEYKKLYLKNLLLIVIQKSLQKPLK